jgi:hypothetical protein
MPRTILTPISAPGPFDLSGAAMTLAAGDAVNGNRFVATGREILIAQNSGASPATVTVQSKAVDNREGDATVAIAAGAYRIFQVFPTKGWMQSDGYIWVDVTDAAIKLAVVKLP